MIPAAIPILTAASLPRVRPLASIAASSTSSVKVIAPATCTTSGVSPLASSMSMYCGSSVV